MRACEGRLRPEITEFNLFQKTPSLRAGPINPTKQRTIMEFLEFLMLTASMLLLIYKPEKEKLAWQLLIISWGMVVFMYIGHVSNSILGSLNL